MRLTIICLSAVLHWCAVTAHAARLETPARVSSMTRSAPHGRIARFLDFEGPRAIVVGGLALLTLLGVLIAQRRAHQRTQAQLSKLERRSAAELLLHRQQLTHLTRVAILGELSGAIAHELNQPLTSILSNAQAAQHLLSREPPDVHEMRQILTDIINDDRRAGEIIHHLRALLTRGETHFEGLDVAELVHDVLIVTRGELIRRSVQLQTRLEEPLPSVRGDRVELQQVLLNLVFNACESMSEAAAPDRQIEIVAARDGAGAVRVSVLDRGHGLAPEQLERVFDSFFTTKAQGLGLGLAISRSIIVAHEGRLWATNRVTGGAAFHFTVPVLQREESHEQSTPYGIHSR